MKDKNLKKDKATNKKAKAKKLKKLNRKLISGLEESIMSDQISNDAIKRLETIPLFYDTGSKAKASEFGTVKFDSWQGGTSLKLRDASDGHIRRITFKAGTLSVEFVAEKRANEWEFVARIYKNGQVLQDLVIKADRKKIFPQSGGFYIWSSKLVPKAIEVIGYDKTYRFEKISW